MEDAIEEKTSTSIAVVDDNDKSSDVGSQAQSQDEGKQNDGQGRSHVLKRGDLVKIVARNGGRLKDRNGDLGRVVRVVPTEKSDDENEESTEHDTNFMYDIELILGRKISGLKRSDLVYTTASEEGMTGESRVKRKRKPTAVQELSNEQKTMSKTAKAKKKPAAKKQKKEPATNKKNTAKKATGKTTKTTTKKAGTTTSTTKKGGASKKRAASTEKVKASSKKAKNIPDEEPAPISTTMELFDRHQREFERALARLEKADAYHYFLGEVPEEFDECYDANRQDDDRVTPDDETMKSSEPEHGREGLMTAAPADSTQQQQIENGTSTADEVPEEPNQPLHEKIKSESQQQTNPGPSSTNDDVAKAPPTNGNNKEAPKFPPHAPYNFHVLRKRMEHGRYILDREALEHEERIKLLTPYYRAVGRKLPRRNGKSRKQKEKSPILHPKAIDWDVFRQDILGMCDGALERNPDAVSRSVGSLRHIVKKLKELIEQVYEKTARRHETEISLANDRNRFSMAINAWNNNEAAMQGKWKKDAFPERRYERLKTDVVCAGLSKIDERIASYELRTTLEDKFVGLSYTYDDTGQSEGWMKSVLHGKEDQSEREKASLAMASDDGVIKAQVSATMQSLLIGVQDRVMTENGVLEQPELRSANWEEEESSTVSAQKTANTTAPNDVASFSGPEIVEQPVWGIDCYTRRNISICLETEFDSDSVLIYLEKWLLPAINACPLDLAHDLSNAIRILEGLPFDTSTSLEGEGSKRATTTEQWKKTLLGKALLNKIKSSGPPWLQSASNLLRRARDALGPDFFRVHPKGHGSIVLCPKLLPNRLVTYYRGEVYPSWRWGEKMDAISLIQKRKGLKPVLPDFFNMALERPQTDPRGYGMLFVDASRKSGYGSMLSHSCTPSCEVRVAAVNGKLTLAMTTLREMSIGDELTFNYNAVTESLNEYRSAVCLCGHADCKGSFLHFATADCYQQVLNRNAPIAVRLSELIKGCMKQVMSEDDEQLLHRHGFKTAAFGAVSVNRHKATNLGSILDSMDMVPVWLRTFVADTLRYIEYERRALPIALICNELFTESADGKEPYRPQQCTIIKEPPETTQDDDKPIKGARHEPSFFFYSRVSREELVTSIIEADESKKSLVGIDLKREIQKLASSRWKTMDEKEKQRWKELSIRDWEDNGGREKAKLEAARVARLAKAKTDTAKKNGTKANTTKSATKRETKKGGPGNKTGSKKAGGSAETQKVDDPPKISFQMADGEGINAMEQRIQQLTQTLSRVGRVLDRHREVVLEKREQKSENSSPDDLSSSASMCKLIHTPFSIMPTAHIVAWMWNHPEGVVKQLLHFAERDICVSPNIRKSLSETKAKFEWLEGFGQPWLENDARIDASLDAEKGRTALNEALMEFRTDLLDGIREMADDIKNRKATIRKNATRKRREEAKKKSSSDGSEDEETRSIVKNVLESLIDAVEQRMGETTNSQGQTSSGECPTPSADSVGNDESKAGGDGQDDFEENLDPWLQNFNKRFKLEKAADILLLYARTSTFFALKPYSSLQSSPIEVYARELGNSVPRSAMDSQPGLTNGSLPQQGTQEDIEHGGDGDVIESNSQSPVVKPKVGRPARTKLCEPDDIISMVEVEYQGDYVVSQLLQWYNAGIDHMPGLPNLLGCALLPPMSGCWTIDGTQGRSFRTDRPTTYKLHTRRKLIDWFKDPFKRGSAWPEELRRALVPKRDDGSGGESPSDGWQPIGSPVLDFLVTGDDFNINSILKTIGGMTPYGFVPNGGGADGLLSTVDHGRPAQAVSNWVQCENPNCLKWRKVPWHVDIDMLSEHFYCKDNVWNPRYASCDAPGDEWDENADAQVDVDGSAYHIEKPPEKVSSQTDQSNAIPSCKLADFAEGARFDVLRTGKTKWCVGIVVKLDIGASQKRVKFHFPKLHVKFDEWIEIDSMRVAPLHTVTPPPAKKEVPSKKEALVKKESPTKKEISTKKEPRAKKEVSAKKDLPVKMETKQDEKEEEKAEKVPKNSTKDKLLRLRKKSLKNSSSSNPKRSRSRTMKLPLRRVAKDTAKVRHDDVGDDQREVNSIHDDGLSPGSATRSVSPVQKGKLSTGIDDSSAHFVGETDIFDTDSESSETGEKVVEDKFDEPTETDNPVTRTSDVKSFGKAREVTEDDSTDQPKEMKSTKKNEKPSSGFVIPRKGRKRKNDFLEQDAIQYGTDDNIPNHTKASSRQTTSEGETATDTTRSTKSQADRIPRKRRSKTEQTTSAGEVVDSIGSNESSKSERDRIPRKRPSLTEQTVSDGEIEDPACSVERQANRIPKKGYPNVKHSPSEGKSNDWIGSNGYMSEDNRLARKRPSNLKQQKLSSMWKAPSEEEVNEHFQLRRPSRSEDPKETMESRRRYSDLDRQPRYTQYRDMLLASTKTTPDTNREFEGNRTNEGQPIDHFRRDRESRRDEPEPRGRKHVGTYREMDQGPNNHTSPRRRDYEDQFRPRERPYYSRDEYSDHYDDRRCPSPLNETSRRDSRDYGRQRYFEDRDRDRDRDREYESYTDYRHEPSHERYSYDRPGDTAPYRRDYKPSASRNIFNDRDEPPPLREDRYSSLYTTSSSVRSRDNDERSPRRESYRDEASNRLPRSRGSRRHGAREEGYDMNRRHEHR